jgi:hypothetical protein
MREIDFDEDVLSPEEEQRLRDWAAARCEAWNWNADVAEIAHELIHAGVDTDSHQFRVLCEVFNKFFNNPQMDVTEAIERIMETFS